jgi:hypothetical protein
MTNGKTRLVIPRHNPIDAITMNIGTRAKLSQKGKTKHAEIDQILFGQ